MTLAAILAEHAAKSATPVFESVARCGAGTVGTPSATLATPATPQKTTTELEAFRQSLAVEREQLLGIAVAEHIDAAHVHRLHDIDVAAYVGFPDSHVAAYLTMLAVTAERHAGRVPDGDTAPMHCERCGPVWIHPSVAEVLPVVAGWPRALGCPWCFVRKVGGHIPRPLVPGDYHTTRNPHENT